MAISCGTASGPDPVRSPATRSSTYASTEPPAHEIQQTRNVLDPNALTLGFARRFTAYKRPYSSVI